MVYVFHDTNLENLDLLYNNRIAITRYVVENFEQSAILYKITIYFKSKMSVRNETREIYKVKHQLIYKWKRLSPGTQNATELLFQSRTQFDNGHSPL